MMYNVCGTLSCFAVVIVHFFGTLEPTWPEL